MTSWTLLTLDKVTWSWWPSRETSHKVRYNNSWQARPVNEQLTMYEIHPRAESAGDVPAYTDFWVLILDRLSVRITRLKSIRVRRTDFLGFQKDGDENTICGWWNPSAAFYLLAAKEFGSTIRKARSWKHESPSVSALPERRSEPLM